MAVVRIGGLLMAPPTMVMCDGSYPTWMLDDDYDGSGCVDFRPSFILEGLLPWNWGAPEVCIGLCQTLEDVYVPEN